MKLIKYLLLFILFPLVYGCQNEDSVPKGIGATFMKFIGTDVNITAVAALENEDGSLMLLANAAEATDDEPEKWIKLIKTDNGGNILWTKNFESNTDDYVMYTASNMIAYDAGYLIIGESINENGTSILIIKVRDNGELQQEMIITPEIVETFQGKDDPGYSLKGKALYLDASSNELFFLAEKNYTGNTTNYALFGQLDYDNLTIIKVNDNFGAGTATFTRDLTARGQELVFGSYVRSSEGTFIRVTPAGIDDLSTPAGFELSSSAQSPHWYINQVRYNSLHNILFAVGETSTNLDFAEEAVTDRVLVIFDKNGSLDHTDAFKIVIDDPNTPGEEAATGYVGTINQQGNLVIAGSVGNEEGERKLFLQKIDHLRNTMWDAASGEGKGRIYGGNGEIPAAIVNTKDGGYFVLCTTNLGNLGSLLLIKTDANGNL